VVIRYRPDTSAPEAVAYAAALRDHAAEMAAIRREALERADASARRLAEASRRYGQWLVTQPFEQVGP
jgi:hypothetical protein